MKVNTYLIETCTKLKNMSTTNDRPTIMKVDGLANYKTQINPPFSFRNALPKNE